MSMMTFGPPWDAPLYDEAQRWPEIPTYARCLWCREFFVDGDQADQGVVIPTAGAVDPEYLVGVGGSVNGSTTISWTATHRECLLAETSGHVVGVCGCTREDWPSRAASLEVARRWDFKKAVDAGEHGAGCGRWGCPCMQLGPVCEEPMTDDTDICIRCGWAAHRHEEGEQDGRGAEARHEDPDGAGPDGAVPALRGGSDGHVGPGGQAGVAGEVRRADVGGERDAAGHGPDRTRRGVTE